MQKTPSSFRLLPFALTATFCFVLFALSLSSCKMNPDMQTPGQAYLQGIWQQDSVPAQKKLITYSLYHLRFSCDSFFMSINSFSKVNYGADTCMSRGHWVEYTRGHYVQRNDTLFLKGQFANADYTVRNDPGCFHIGDYKEFFKITKKTDSVIQLSSTSGVIPITARLIKRITCQVKPL
jgi:hypothetical protein